MAELVKIHDNHEGFFDVLAALFRYAKVQPSRNGKTLEVEDLIIEVSNPVFNSPAGVRPGYNDSIGVVEGLQLLAGISDSGLTAEIQPQFRAYMDDGKFWGAYGPRTVNQFPVIADRLAADNDTRQAVITLWDPAYDALGGKKDHPCTTAFFFLVRDQKLNMKVVMRSMDLWWGWPYDAVQFSMVHQSMANVLGLDVGTYTHHAVSAHLYEPHWEAARDTLTKREITETRQPVLGFNGDSWQQVQAKAVDTLRVVTGSYPASALTDPEQQIYAQQLLERRTKVIAKNLEAVKKLDVW